MSPPPPHARSTQVPHNQTDDFSVTDDESDTGKCGMCETNICPHCSDSMKEIALVSLLYIWGGQHNVAVQLSCKVM